MRNSKCYFIILLLLFNTYLLYAQVQLLNPKLDGNITQVQFVDDNYGWFLTSLGTIYGTTNGGLKWENKLSNNIISFKAIDTYHIYALSTHQFSSSDDGGITWKVLQETNNKTTSYFESFLYENGVITLLGYFTNTGIRSQPTLFRSFDGGISWSKVVFAGNGTNKFDVFKKSKFITQNLGWAIEYNGYDYYIVKTVDGGLTWNYQYWNSSTEILNILAINENTIFFIGNDRTTEKTSIYKSSDGGWHWRIVQDDIGDYDPDNVNIVFTNDSCGFCILRNSSTCLETTDSGETWKSKDILESISDLQDADVRYDIHSQKLWYVCASQTNGTINFLRTVDAGVHWKNNTFISNVTSNSLNDICIVEPNLLWACGAAGTIIKSSNNGETWKSLQSNTSIDLKSIFFKDAAHGWVVGTNGVIINTIDGGDTWKLQNSGIKGTLNDVLFYDDDLGWACGNDTSEYDGRLIKTTDGGNTWYKTPLRIDFTLTSITFFNNSQGIVWGNRKFTSPNEMGYIGGFFKSTDGGESWNQINYDYTDFIVFKNINEIWRIIGTKLDSSTDGGTTWTNKVDVYNSHDSYRTLRNLIVPDSSTIIFINTSFDKCCGGSDDLYFSDDNGNNWKDINIRRGYENGVNSLNVSSSKDIYLVGMNGLIWKINHEDILTSVDEKEGETMPQSFILSQNYPNPFNPSTTIKYSIPVETRHGASLHVTLKVYDVLGREVVTLVNETKQSGNYEVKFNGANIPSGVYFYKLTAGDYSQTKKMTLIR